MRAFLAAAVLVFGLSGPAIHADEAPAPAAAPEPAHRPKVILVLSGGGARGSAHIGVLKVLEEYHVPVDMVVGTSMGSIVGGLYAAGWSTEEIETKILTIDWSSVFIDRLKRQDKSFRRKQEDERFLVPIKMRFKNWKPYLPPAVIGGQNLEMLFQSLEIEATGEQDFDRLPVPYRAVAADLSNGRAVVLRRGSLATAMRASMSLPGIFPPVELDGKPLTDGGVAANFPIRIARGLGADVIIGVDITSPLRKKEELGSFLTRIDQTTSLLTNGNKEADMEAVRPGDVIVVPDLGDITFSDFAKARETIDRGETAARAMEAQLRALAVGEAEWAAYMARHVRRPASELKLDDVRIENTGPLSDEIVAAQIDLPTGGTLDEDEVMRQIRRLYGLDVFGTIHHDFQRKDGQGVLTLQVPKKPYGRNSLQFGFSLVSDFHGELDFNLTVSHLFNPINRKGGEWRNIIQVGDNDLVSTEYYQPLDARLAWVFDTSAEVRRDRVQFFTAEGDALASYDFHSGTWRAGFGRVLGRWGQIALGGFRGYSRGGLVIGSPVFPTVENDNGGAYLSFDVDTRDSVTWPRGGTRVHGVYVRDLESFGADATGSTAELQLRKAITLGKNVMLLSAEARDVVSGPVTYQNASFLGGFLRLSGYANNQLIGNRSGLARFMYYRELSRFDLGSLTQRMYVGFSLEAGNVYTTDAAVTWPSLTRAGSVYVGADTILGPAYLGYGYADGGWDSFYLSIGQRF